MDQAAARAAVSPTNPSESAPEKGTISFFDTLISDVEHWQEDGDYVFRSTEFDLIAGAPDLLTAVMKFIDGAVDLAKYLIELEQADEITEGERSTMHLLLPRVFEALSRMEQQLKEERLRQQRKRVPFFGRRRGGDIHGGFHPSQPTSSSQPQLV